MTRKPEVCTINLPASGNDLRIWLAWRSRVRPVLVFFFFYFFFLFVLNRGYSLTLQLDYIINTVADNEDSGQWTMDTYTGPTREAILVFLCLAEPRPLYLIS